MTSCNLRAVRALIESGWHAGSLARDKDGLMVRPEDPTAVSWCLVGAIGKAGGIAYDPEYAGYLSSPEFKVLERVAGRMPFEPASHEFPISVQYNDEQTESGPVLALIDEAIADAEAIEQEHFVGEAINAEASEAGHGRQIFDHIFA